MQKGESNKTPGQRGDHQGAERVGLFPRDISWGDPGQAGPWKERAGPSSVWGGREDGDRYGNPETVRGQ